MIGHCFAFVLSEAKPHVDQVVAATLEILGVSEKALLQRRRNSWVQIDLKGAKKPMAA